MDERAGTHPHPRREPRFAGELTPENLSGIFRDCVDSVERTVRRGEGGGRQLTLCYLSGMVRLERINDYLRRPMVRDPALAACGRPRAVMERMRQGALYNLSVE